jgi:O-methyltransferase
MVKNGIILIHDFFNEGYPGVKEAVLEFEKEMNGAMSYLPIGDGYSVVVYFHS